MNGNPLLWLVDGNAGARLQLRDALESSGFEVRAFAEGSLLERRLVRERPAALLVAIAPAPGGGFDLCRRIRSNGDDVPIVLLAEKGDPEECVAAFECDADDYVSRTCDRRELVARLRFLLRRREAALPGTPALGEIPFGDCRLDFTTRSVYRGDNKLDLTSGEFSLLCALARHPHRPLTRERLLELARGPGSATSVRSVDVLISRLRKLVEADPTRPRCIQTVWGHGYVFVPDSNVRSSELSREAAQSL